MGNVVRACSDDDPLRVELLFKDVADCLERSAVPPETTSFGNGARASSSYAKRASQGVARPLTHGLPARALAVRRAAADLAANCFPFWREGPGEWSVS
jgi:hypothetical protein